MKTKRDILRKHLIPHFGRMRLADIGPAQTEAFKASLLKAGLSPKSVNNCLTVLRSLLAKAVEFEVLAQVPRVQWLKVPKAERRGSSPKKTAASSGTPNTRAPRPSFGKRSARGPAHRLAHPPAHVRVHLVMRGGGPLRAVQELLGHTTIQMTERYAHLSPDVRRDAVRVLDTAQVQGHGPYVAQSP